MAMFLRLQNLPDEADNLDIRNFFYNFDIPEGGVQIIGGKFNEAFIYFKTELDLLRSLEHQGQLILGQPMRLLFGKNGDFQEALAAQQSHEDQDHMSASPPQSPPEVDNSHGTGRLSEVSVSSMIPVDPNATQFSYEDHDGMSPNPPHRLLNEGNIQQQSRFSEKSVDESLNMSSSLKQNLGDEDNFHEQSKYSNAQDRAITKYDPFDLEPEYSNASPRPKASPDCKVHKSNYEDLFNPKWENNLQGPLALPTCNTEDATAMKRSHQAIRPVAREGKKRIATEENREDSVAGCKDGLKQCSRWDNPFKKQALITSSSGQISTDFSSKQGDLTRNPIIYKDGKTETTKRKRETVDKFDIFRKSPEKAEYEKEKSSANFDIFRKSPERAKYRRKKSPDKLYSDIFRASPEKENSNQARKDGIPQVKIQEEISYKPDLFMRSTVEHGKSGIDIHESSINTHTPKELSSNEKRKSIEHNAHTTIKHFMPYSLTCPKREIVRMHNAGYKPNTQRSQNKDQERNEEQTWSEEQSMDQKEREHSTSRKIATHEQMNERINQEKRNATESDRSRNQGRIGHSTRKEIHTRTEDKDQSSNQTKGEHCKKKEGSTDGMKYDWIRHQRTHTEIDKNNQSSHTEDGKLIRKTYSGTSKERHRERSYYHNYDTSKKSCGNRDRDRSPKRLPSGRGGSSRYAKSPESEDSISSSSHSNKSSESDESFSSSSHHEKSPERDKDSIVPGYIVVRNLQCTVTEKDLLEFFKGFHIHNKGIIMKADEHDATARTAYVKFVSLKEAMNADRLSERRLHFRRVDIEMISHSIYEQVRISEMLPQDEAYSRSPYKMNEVKKQSLLMPFNHPMRPGQQPTSPVLKQAAPDSTGPIPGDQGPHPGGVIARPPLQDPVHPAKSTRTSKILSQDKSYELNQIQLQSLWTFNDPVTSGQDPISPALKPQAPDTPGPILGHQGPDLSDINACSPTLHLVDAAKPSQAIVAIDSPKLPTFPTPSLQTVSSTQSKTNISKTKADALLIKEPVPSTTEGVTNVSKLIDDLIGKGLISASTTEEKVQESAPGCTDHYPDPPGPQLPQWAIRNFGQQKPPPRHFRHPRGPFPHCPGPMGFGPQFPGLMGPRGLGPMGLGQRPRGPPRQMGPGSGPRGLNIMGGIPGPPRLGPMGPWLVGRPGSMGPRPMGPGLMGPWPMAQPGPGPHTTGPAGPYPMDPWSLGPGRSPQDPGLLGPKATHQISSTVCPTQQSQSQDPLKVGSTESAVQSNSERVYAPLKAASLKISEIKDQVDIKTNKDCAKTDTIQESCPPGPYKSQKPDNVDDEVFSSSTKPDNEQSPLWCPLSSLFPSPKGNPQFYLGVTDVNDAVTASQIWNMLGGVKGTAQGVVLTRVPPNHGYLSSMAFAVYNNRHELETALDHVQKHAKKKEIWMHYSISFVVSFFKSLENHCLVFVSTMKGIDRLLLLYERNKLGMTGATE